MFKTIVTYFTLPMLFLFGISSATSENSATSRDAQTRTLEKLIVASGSVAMDLDLSRLNGSPKEPQRHMLHFGVAPNSFFTILVFNNELRELERGSMRLVPEKAAGLPQALNASISQLVVEKLSPGEPYEIVVRDAKTGFTFFNIEGNQYRLRCSGAVAEH